MSSGYVTTDGFLTGLTCLSVNRPHACSAKLQTRQTRQDGGVRACTRHERGPRAWALRRVDRPDWCACSVTPGVTATVWQRWCWQER
jgi:hypothetical protein